MLMPTLDDSTKHTGSRWAFRSSQKGGFRALGLVFILLGSTSGSYLTFAQVSGPGGLGDYSDTQVALHPVGTSVVGKTPVTVFRSDRVASPFTGVVARVRGLDPGSVSWIRIFDGEAPTGWAKATVLSQDGNPIGLLAWHSDRVYSERRFEIAVSGEGTIEILEAGVFDNRDDDDAKEIEWDIGNTFKGHSAGKIIPPRLIKREEWGARPFRGEPIPLARPTYEYITFHHTACCAATTYEEGIAQVSGIQQFHQDGRGWSDIGYHFLLDQSGRLYQGRPFMNKGADLEDVPILAQGAHVGGANTGNIGVSVLGCYHPSEGAGCRDVLSSDALDSLVTIFAFLGERYEVPPSRIKGHRDFSSTACPGDNNYPLLPEIREMVENLIETGNAPVGAASLTGISDSDGVVKLSWQFAVDSGIVEYSIERRTNNGNEVIYRSDTVEDLSVVDRSVETTGPVTYDLRARNADGRWVTLTSVEVRVVRPRSFQLSPSFPNPTSSSATIRYFLDEEGFVSLELYDARGRRHTVLVSEFQQQGRWYSVPLSVDGLAPGQYYYRMQVDGFSGIVFDESKGFTVQR